MKSFSEHLLLKEEEEIDIQLNEDPFTVMSLVFGYSLNVLIVGFGARLMFGDGGISNAVSSVVKFFKRSGKNVSRQDAEKVVRKMNIDPVVDKVDQQLKSEEKKFDQKFSDVVKAIENKNAEEALEQIKDLPLSLRKSPELNKLVVVKSSEAFDEPPIHFGNTGNETYMFIKKVLGIKEAKAAAETVKLALSKYAKNLVEEKDANN